MTYRILFIMVAVLATATLPDPASAQCMECAPCAYGSGLGCQGAVEGGAQHCAQQGEEDGEGGLICLCGGYGGDCQADALADRDAKEHLPMVLVSLQDGKMLPADGPLYFATAGADIVFRRKCDGE